MGGCVQKDAAKLLDWKSHNRPFLVRGSMKAIILARVSSKEQEDNNSIPAQTRRLHEYVERFDLNLLETYQLVESSTKANRRKFNELINKIRDSDERIALIVDTIDRLQRDFRESVMLNELRLEGKIELHFVRENLVINQVSNSADILRWDMGVMFAKSYVTQLSDNVRRSFEQKLRNGEWLSKAPFGYTNVDLPDGKKWIQPDSVNAKVVADMYYWYGSASYSMKEIRAKLIAEHSIKMAVSMVDRILKNPFYYGVMRVKESDYPHKYEPILTKAAYDKVQEVKLGFNKKNFKYAGLPFYYRGLMQCAECGCSISPEKSKGYTYYHCTQYKGKHGAAYMREEELTEQLKLAFQAIKLTPTQYDQVSEVLRTSHKDKIKYKAQHTAHLQTELTKYQQRLEKLYEAHLDGDLDDEFYKRKVDEYRSARDSVKVKLDATDKADDSFYTAVDNLIRLGQSAPQLLESSEMEYRRRLINLVLQNLTIKDKQLRWEYKKPFDILARTAKSQNWLGMRDSNPRCQDQNLVPYHLANPQ